MSDPSSRFLRHYGSAQQSLFAYIRSAGFTLTDTEDVLQDVSVALWGSFSSYDEERPFVAWAIGIARNLIQKHQRGRRVRRQTRVDTEVLQRLADQAAAALESYDRELSDEKSRMEECLDALPDKARDLLEMRYGQRLSLDEIAERLGKSYGAASMVISRIRAKLVECVSLGPKGVGA
jgi:RNA polymerase sigma-70 factor (ECF subfamily)